MAPLKVLTNETRSRNLLNGFASKKVPLFFEWKLISCLTNHIAQLRTGLDGLPLPVKKCWREKKEKMFKNRLIIIIIIIMIIIIMRKARTRRKRRNYYF